MNKPKIKGIYFRQEFGGVSYRNRVVGIIGIRFTVVSLYHDERIDCRHCSEGECGFQVTSAKSVLNFPQECLLDPRLSNRFVTCVECRSPCVPNPVYPPRQERKTRVPNAVAEPFGGCFS